MTGRALGSFSRKRKKLISDEAKATGIIPIPPKLLSRLHTIELENNVYQTKFNANQVTAKMLIEGYLEDACGIDLEAEKWEVEVPQRRFRKADVRPPELRPEMEVKPGGRVSEEVGANGTQKP
jgi:hypothetical protein